ncbi:MAG: CAP domain-containing protein [Kofleriaceae bacterium]
MRLAAVLVLVGCGRFGFAPTTDGRNSSSGDDDGSIPGDGKKPIDADLSATCGDLTCTASAGETCQSCASDCKTTSAVCGNLACDPGEDGASCEIDCGPSPWTWVQDETDLLTAINNARAGGVTCNGTQANANAVVLDTTMQAAARSLAWESAQYNTVTIRRCDGQLLSTWLSAIPASSYRLSSGVASAGDRVAAWAADNNACASLVDNTRTKIGIGIATGAANTEYVVVMR